MTARAVRQGISVDESVLRPLAEGLTAVFGAAYYLLVRAVEHKRTWTGLLLGTSPMPSYGS